MKLIYQNRGYHWAVGMEGSKKDIKIQFDSFYNHGAIDQTAKLNWLGSHFAYVWTTEERLKKYFKNASYHEVLNSIDESSKWIHKGLRFGATVSRKIRERAQERFDAMTPENYLKSSDRFLVAYDIGTICAESPSE